MQGGLDITVWWLPDTNTMELEKCISLLPGEDGSLECMWFPGFVTAWQSQLSPGFLWQEKSRLPPALSWHGLKLKYIFQNCQFDCVLAVIIKRAYYLYSLPYFWLKRQGFFFSVCIHWSLWISRIFFFSVMLYLRP